MYIFFFLIIVWFILYRIGKMFALRDRLQKADAIVCLAGTRGNIETLHERIDTAIRLYKGGFAGNIIMSSMFSKKVKDDFKQVERDKIVHYAEQGRITKDHVDFAYNNWDLDLGADYMKEYAIKKGIPKEHILVENESLHTRENAEYTLKILEKHKWKTIILVTSPFHQRRASKAFTSVMHKHGIKIINYAADSHQWNYYLWFLSIENLRLVGTEVRRLLTYRKQY